MAPDSRNGSKVLLVGPVFSTRKPGLAQRLRKAARSANYVIAVDGGLDFCARAGIRPDLAVGDWDSLRDLKLKDHVTAFDLPVNKDRSDLYFALDRARRLGFLLSLTCIGFSGGRPDHHFAVLQELSLFSQKGMPRFSAPPVLLADDAEYLFLSSRAPEYCFNAKNKRVVSIFAMNAAVEGLTLEGFRYPLRKARLSPSSRGLSNVTNAVRCRIKLERGRLLVVLPDELG